ncbi:hypothetical protein [Nocardia asiatica]|uniref:hypothetical protein n=1 Tax=Nocardia asiatica TaxID=209252 RepID=UPI003EE15AD1
MASVDNAAFMTGQRPPGCDSTRVGFVVFAAAFVLDMMLHIAVGVVVWYAKFARLNENLSPLTQTAVDAQQAAKVSSDVARIAAGAETQQKAPQQGYSVGANPWENG